MALFDWLIILIYILIIISLSFFVGKKQNNQEDYYLGGKRLKYWQVGGSLVANQISAISLVGVPAFIAIKKNGGLKWLQYEIAVPLAMIFIIFFLLPVYRKYSKLTIYEYLEKRFNQNVRIIMSGIFLVSRSLATGVALLATSYVTAIAINIDIKATILLIGIISIIYTSLGGIKADIYSDIIQLIILWISSFVTIFILFKLLNGSLEFTQATQFRLKIYDFSSTGFNDSNSFSFLPMLIGGLFLYISYYGCDQSQSQRLLTTKTEKEAKRALLLNSFLRFPLVLTYSAVGILILIFISKNSFFFQKIKDLPPDYLMPMFFKEYLPAGILGLVVSGVFAASMSSLDSAINSLSASLWDDMLIKIKPGLRKLSDKKKILLSRIITIIWGFFTIGFAIVISNSSETVVEIVNKIGSVFYGPIAAVFTLGIFTKIKNNKSIIFSLSASVSLNIILWLFFKKLSWLWWNALGFSTGFMIPVLIYFINKKHNPIEIQINKSNHHYFIKLFLWFLIILIILYLIQINLFN